MLCPFHMSAEAGFKVEISSQNPVYRLPVEFTDTFFPETLSLLFDWRKLKSCAAEYGLLITSAGLNGSMDQN